MPDWLARKARLLRVRRDWRQVDLAFRAAVSRGTVARIEGDRVDEVTVGALRKVSKALDAWLVIDFRWRGPELDRLLDAHHAALQEWLAALLGRHGWVVRAEVSFNQYGDRGRYDLLAYYPVARILLVAEVKTSVADVQELLGRLDTKLRVARTVARGLGWEAEALVPLLLLAEGTSTRRHVRAHPTLFARFAVRGRAAAAWLHQPSVGEPHTGLLLYRKLPYARHSDVIVVRRVRKPHTPATRAVGAPGALRRR